MPDVAVQLGARTRWLHSRAPFNPVAAQAFRSKIFPQCANSNNLLAVELEKENDATENFFDRLFQSLISVEASAPATAIRIFSNDQHVDTCNNARRIHPDRAFRGGDAGIFTSADRCPAQRHSIRMPLGL